MFLTHINLATNLNNRGAHLLECCSYSEAMSAFQQSIAYMKRAADEFALESRAEKNVLKRENQYDWAAQGPFHQTVFQHSEVPKCGEDKHGGNFTYDRAFRLAENFQVKTEAQLSFLGAVVLTNYGISWQLKGNEMDGNESCQKKAFQLYQLTLNMLEQSKIQEMAEASKLSLVVFNNMAKLHHDNCSYAQANICLQTVSCLMRAIDVEFLNETEVEQISMNIHFLVPPVAARAA